MDLKLGFDPPITSIAEVPCTISERLFYYFNLLLGIVACSETSVYDLVGSTLGNAQGSLATFHQTILARNVLTVLKLSRTSINLSDFQAVHYQQTNLVKISVQAPNTFYHKLI